MYTNRGTSGPTPIATGPSTYNGAGSTGGTGDAFDRGVVTSFLLAFAAYVAWAYLETHETIRGSVKPSNIVLNLRTIALITFTAVIGINAGRIVLGKLALWKIPGASYLLTLWANA